MAFANSAARRALGRQLTPPIGLHYCPFRGVSSRAVPESRMPPRRGHAYYVEKGTQTKPAALIRGGYY